MNLWVLSESSSRGMIRVLLVYFLWQSPGWDVSLCDDCMRWGLTGAPCSYLDSINQNLASWLLSIQIPDQSNGQIIIAKKYWINFPSDISSLCILHIHSISTQQRHYYCNMTVAPNNRPHCHSAADAAQMSLNLWICTSTSARGWPSPRDYDDWLLRSYVLPWDGGMGDGPHTT